LHHEVKGSSLYQADSGKASGSTLFERKQMSTKTTLKRIALVAVSALSFGMLSLVATPSANALGVSVASAVTATDVTNARPGVAVTIPVTFTLPSSTVLGTDSLLVLARVTAAPANSASVERAADGTNSGAVAATAASTNLNWTAASNGSGSFGSVTTDTDNSVSGSVVTTGVENWAAANVYTTGAADTATTMTLNLTFTPDQAGTYQILIASGNNAGAYDTAAELVALTTAAVVQNLNTGTVNITTAGAPTTVTLAAVTTGAPKSGATGALYKATLNGSLAAEEKIVLSSTSTTVTFKDHAGAALTVANTLRPNEFTNGVAYFTVQNSVAETATITATGGGLLSAITSSATFTTTTATNGTPTIGRTALSTSMGTDTTADTATVISSAARTTATSQSVTITGTAANVEYVTVTDTDGAYTGKSGAKYDKVVTIGSAGTASFSVPASLGVGKRLTLVLTGSTTTGAKTMNITGRASAATSVTVTNATRRAALAATESFVATVKDQFGAAMIDQSVAVTVSGRNSAKASASYTTNASGQITHSFTDTGTAGTSDTLTFTTGSVSGTATITYGSSTASTVTLVGPNTDDLVITYSDMIDISAAAGGATGSLATVTATIKDASAAVMNGMPVTFAVTGTNCAILSTKVTVYTGADGTAATSVYKWSNGTCAVTATSGGVTSAADTVHFAQKTATEARTLAGTVAGNVITATVKDRFGNPINGAYVWATRTGGGFFANGASSTSAATGEDGTVQFVYSTDPTTAGSVKLALGSSTAADPEYGQSAAGANLVTSPSLATDIFTATTAGTATTAETGVGASIAPAGVNSVTVTVAAAPSASQTAAEAASDAAAEAIDAANAATDAANLAAEAADAATVAAEEARDAADAATAAVEELATQVATLMAALKAQITTLANTVAKIAKKVKA
jgi:hypothetical protein